MFTARTKIVKDRADQEPTELEDDVAKALFELQEQVSPPSLPSDAAVLSPQQQGIRGDALVHPHVSSDRAAGLLVHPHVSSDRAAGKRWCIPTCLTCGSTAM